MPVVEASSSSFVRNASEKITKWLKSHLRGLGHSLNAEFAFTRELLADVLQIVKNLDSVEELASKLVENEWEAEIAQDLTQFILEYGHTGVTKKELASLARKAKRATASIRRRENYLPKPVFEFYKFVPDGDELAEENYRWRFDWPKRGLGLAECIAAEMGATAEPPYVSILGRVPRKARHFYTDSQAEVLIREGWAMVEGKVAFNVEHPVWNLVLKAFPTSVAASGYASSLTSPMAPNSYMSKVSLTFRTIATGTSTVERDGKFYSEGGINLGTDGSGWYHPDAPQMQELIGIHGLVGFQIRFIHPNGMFCKGNVFPSTESLNEQGEPTVSIDWIQLKGRWKDEAKAAYKVRRVQTVSGFYGCALNVWNQVFHMRCGFEALECMKTTAETKEILGDLVKRSMRRLEWMGIDGLAAQVAKQDPVLALMKRLIDLGVEEGLDLHPTMIPRWRQAIVERANKMLWDTATSGGVKGQCYIARMDSTIPRGKVAISGIKPGFACAVWRFPLIVAQGLLTLETIESPEHLLVNGAETPYLITMNPMDVAATQGDDDGDTYAVSFDPNVIELFNARLDDRFFAIEPMGTKILGEDGEELKTNSAQGLKRLRLDQTGPVGIFTIARSKLLAVGDHMGALACSLLIQEAVDNAKRNSEWSKWWLATNSKNWSQDDQGIWRFGIKLDARELAGGFPMDKFQDWVNDRLIRKGCSRHSFTPDGEHEIVAIDPLWWRNWGTNPRRIDTEIEASFVMPELNEAQEGFENLVHHGVRTANEIWERIADKMRPAEENAAGNALAQLLATRGIHVEARELSAMELLRLRNVTGLKRLTDALLRLPVGNEDDGSGNDIASTRAIRAEEAQAEFESTMIEAWESGEIGFQEVVDIWTNELRARDSFAPLEDGEGFRPNGNNAWRVVAFKGSPVMEVLGIRSDECQFLHGKVKVDGVTMSRLQAGILACMKKPDPAGHLAYILENETQHGLAVQDENGEPLRLHECPTCSKSLADGVVDALRGSKTGGSMVWAKKFHAMLKAGNKKFQEDQLDHLMDNLGAR